MRFKQWSLWITLLLLFLLSGLRVQATHIVGAEIDYQCINPTFNTYNVNLTLYRDVINGVAGFDNQITVFIFRSNGTLFATRLVTLPTGQPDTLPVQFNSCTGTPLALETEFKQYSFNITLPPISGGYDIAWARCCRNNTVTNITNNQGITVLAHVPGTEVPGCNNMPTFNQLPPLFLCVGQPFSFDHSATDIDGDSLVYTISEPYTGINGTGIGATQFNPIVSNGGFNPNPMGPPPYNPVNFVGGFSFTDPFASGNFAIDPQSGLLTLTPNQVGLSVFAVSVVEYRNGVFLSENKRDFQIAVVTCSPQGAEPIIDPDLTNIPVGGAGNPNTGNTGNGILALSNDTIYAMPTTPFCYQVSVQDVNPTDVVELFPVSAAFGIGGTLPPPYATLTTSGTNPANGDICWTVPCNQEGDTIMLVVGGRDTNDCPGYNIVYDTTVVIIGETNPPDIAHSIAGGGDTIIVDPLEPFCYTLSGGDVDTFDVLEFVPIEGPFANQGGPGPYATITSTGLNPISGQVCWTPPCDVAGQTFNFDIAVQDNNFCQKQAVDNVVVIVRDLPSVSVDVGGTICEGDDFGLQAFGGTGYLWSPAGSLNNPNIANPTASPTSTTTYTVLITDSVGCPRPEDVTVNVNPLPLAEAGPDSVKCVGQTITLNASGGIGFDWTPTSGLSATNIANPVADPDSTTTYTVQVTDVNGCQQVDSVTIFAMYAFPGPDQRICIGDSVTLSASGGISYQWLPDSSLIDANTANPTAFPTSTTDYIVAVTDTSGCVDTAIVRVEVDPLPTIGFNIIQEVCIGDTLELIATGGVSYVWDNDPTLINPNVPNTSVFPTVPTNYAVTVTDANGCVNRDSVEVTINPLPIVDAGVDTVKCGNNPIQLLATGGINYFWSPSAGLAGIDTPNPLVNPDSSGYYFVNVTDSNGCQNIDSVFVRAWYAEAGPDVAVCIGDSVSLQASNGVAYQWDASPFLLNTSSPNALAFPTDTTQFFVTMTDTSGCQERDSMTVIVNPLPTTSTFGTDPYVCSGGGTVVNATGGIQYAWEPSGIFDDPTLASPTAFPTYSGTTLDTTVVFYVTVTDTNGCSNRDSLDQVVRLLPIVDFSNDTTKCPEDSIQLFATGGIGYQWTPPVGISNPNIANPFANPDTTTPYTVTITAVWGCADSGVVVINVIHPEAGPDTTICLLDSVMLQASGGVGYSWSPAIGLSDPNISNPMASPPVTTVYTVTVTDTAGCTDVDSVTVFVNPLPPADAGPDQSICIGDTAQLSASGGIAYQWLVTDSLSDDTLANPFAFPLDTTQYIVAVTDTNGCQTTDSMTLTINPLPNANAGPAVDTKCGEAPLQLIASGGDTYTWEPVDFLSDPNIANPMATPDSNFAYTVIVVDSNGCVNQDSISILTMYAQAGGGDSICFGDTLTLLGGQLGGQAVAFSWEPANVILDPNAQNPAVYPGVTTTFVLTVLDSSDCVDTNTVEVFVRPAPPADAGADTAVCIGDPAFLNAEGGVAYQWSPATYLSDINVANPVANADASIQYEVLVTDIFGCTARDTMDLIVNPLPEVIAEGDTSICRGDIAFLSVSGAQTYTWTPAEFLTDPNAADPIAQPDSTMQFNVLGIDVNGCQNRDSLIVEVWQLPRVGAPFRDSICVGQATELSAVGAFDYLWSTGQNGDQIEVAPGQSTDYWVIPIGPNGCQGDTFDIEVYVERTLPLAEFVPDTKEGFYPLPVTFENRSQGSSQYLWDFGDGESSTDESPIHTYNSPGEYQVQLRVDNAIGCPDSISFSLIKVKDFNLLAPNVFTPNNDNRNDQFAIRMNSIEQFEIRIFDRWGREVFYSVDPGFFWDGNRQNGTPAPEGVYVYQIDARTFNGQKVEQKGTVTLVR
ncbi:MAG: gliding motility-associated C-terminal domain-containing protein [Bacteroidota bacterium]